MNLNDKIIDKSSYHSNQLFHSYGNTCQSLQDIIESITIEVSPFGKKIHFHHQSQIQKTGFVFTEKQSNKNIKLIAHDE